MYDAVELEKPDMAFHLGDCIGDAQDLSSAFPMLDLSYVPGNCDYCTSVPASLLQEAGGVRIFLTHGHLFGVKTGLTRLLLEGKRVGAQLVLFGHTHRPYLAEHDGVWLLNPGSCHAGQLCRPDDRERRLPCGAERNRLNFSIMYNILWRLLCY